MNKKELAQNVADKTGLSRADTNRTLEAAFDAIADALVSGEKVQLAGFGSFEPRRREARTGTNPRTREKVQIAASTSAGFKPAKALKDRLNG